MKDETYTRPHKAIIKWLWGLFLKKGCERILDFGCGSIGWFGKHSPDGVKVYGLDKDEEIIEEVREYYNETVSVDILREKPYPNNYFDGIFSYHVLEHIPNDSRVVEILSELLEDKGLIVASSPSMRTWEDCSDHLRGYTKESFYNLFNDNGFEVLKCNYLGGGIPGFGILNLVRLSKRITSFLAKYFNYFRNGVFLIGKRNKKYD